MQAKATFFAGWLSGTCGAAGRASRMGFVRWFSRRPYGTAGRRWARTQGSAALDPGLFSCSPSGGRKRTGGRGGVRALPGLKGETGGTRRGGSSGLQATESSKSTGAFRLGPSFRGQPRRMPSSYLDRAARRGGFHEKGPWLKPRSLRAGIQEPEGSWHLRCGWTRCAHGEGVVSICRRRFSPALRDGGADGGADPGFPLRSAQGSPWAILAFPLRGKGKNRWAGWGWCFPWSQRRDQGHPLCGLERSLGPGPPATASHGSW